MKLLVALDLSDMTEPLMKAVTQISKLTGASTWLLHVAEPEPDFMGYEAGPVVVRDQVAKQFRDEHRAIQKLAEQLRADDVDATALLIQGPTVETVLKEASRLGADLLMVGSHGHGAVYDLLVGSVCNGILKHTTIPVMVVPVLGKDQVA